MSGRSIYKGKSSLLFWIFILMIMTWGREKAHALLATSISDSSRTHKMPEDMTVSTYTPSAEKHRSPRKPPMSRGRLQLTSILSPQPLNISASLKAPSAHDSVECFENISHLLGPTSAEDCRVVIDHIILAYPNPMGPKTFGWNDGRSMSERRVLCLMIKIWGPGN